MVNVAREAREQSEQVELLARMRQLFGQVDVGGREIYNGWRTRVRRRAFIPGAWNFAA
jgi:hypothetical protein